MATITGREKRRQVPKIYYDTSRDVSLRAITDCDCDCACDSSIGTTAFLSYKSRSTKDPVLCSLPGIHHIKLDEDHTVCFGATQPPVVVNRSALEVLNYFAGGATFEGLCSSWGETPDDPFLNKVFNSFLDLGYLSSASGIPAKLSGYPHTMSVWLHVTDRCNLRCAYCYLPHRREDMSLETGRRVINLAFESAILRGYRRVKLKYAGGEPMISLDVVQQLHQYAQTQASEIGLELDGVVLSNGTLLDKTALDRLKTSGLRLMISVDGLDGYHDRQRHYLNGGRCANHVWKAVDAARQYGLEPVISVTVTPGSAPGLPKLVEQILERQLPFSLNFYRENAQTIHLENIRANKDTVVDYMLETFSIIRSRMPKRSLLGNLIDKANLATPHLRTCGVGDSYLVFDQHGTRFDCQMQMAEPRQPSQCEESGVVVKSKHDNCREILNLTVDEKEGCRDCEWKYWCAGGCPLVTFRATGRFDVRSPNCEIYQALFAEAMKLEGFRLLEHYAN